MIQNPKSERLQSIQLGKKEDREAMEELYMAAFRVNLMLSAKK